MHKYSSVVLRFGLGAVLLWFGLSQLIAPVAWTSFLPSWIAGIITPETFVIINGLSEVVLGVMLLGGIFTRIIAILTALHLASILFSVGYSSDIAVRDFGLMMAAIALALFRDYPVSIDNFLKK